MFSQIYGANKNLNLLHERVLFSSVLPSGLINPPSIEKRTVHVTYVSKFCHYHRPESDMEFVI